MSNYNSYARKLDTAFKTAREAYNEAYTELNKAKSEYTDKARFDSKDSEYTWKVRKTEAEAKLAKAEQKFHEVRKGCWETFRKEAEALKADFTKEIMGDGLANPDAIDNNAVELLRSRVLSVDDMEHFVDKYDTNPTMLKLVSKYAKDMASEEKDTDTRARLNQVAVNTATGTSKKVLEFEELVRSSYIYGGLTRTNNSPDFVYHMANRWDEFAPSIDSF